MPNITKEQYALEVLDALEKSNQIVADAKLVNYSDFTTDYSQALCDMDYDDFNFHCFEIPVFTKDETEEDPIEVITFENPFAYGNYLVSDLQGIDYDNYDFRVEEDYERFLRDFIRAVVLTHTEEGVTLETLDVETSLSAMFEDNYGLKDLLPVIFISDLVTNELGIVTSHLKSIHDELNGAPYLIDLSLVYKPFDSTVFYESSKCW